MCGFLGSVNGGFDCRSLDQIRHRGPDSRGFEMFDVGSHRVTLGHCRLAILDLTAAGHQPMARENGTAWLVYNGEIYNHAELRNRLGPVSWAGHSDTETMLELIRQSGVDAIRNANGIFAFAYVDAARRRMWLARDCFGVKPLYYWHRGNRLLFCSELLPLQRIVSEDLDPQNLAEFLRLGYSPSPDTLLHSIRQVRPGHIVEVNLEKEVLTVREYPYANRPDAELKIDYREACRVYGELLEAAVKRQLMSDVEVGVLLSGGVDSALIARLAQKNSGYKLKSFTVGFTDNDASNEIEDARQTAALLGLDHYEVRIGFEDFAQILKQCVETVEAPVATTSLVPLHYLSNLAARSVKVVVSGQGADEPLGGYNRYQGELWRERLPRVAFDAARTVARLTRSRNDRLTKGAVALRASDDVDRFVRVYSIFDESEILALVGSAESLAAKRVRYFYDLLGCGRRRRAVERMMSVDLRMQLADNLLAYTDKITMRHSLECRVPMLDLELVRFMEALPASYRVRLGRRKIIHKDYARQVLPQTIIGRKKRGFGSPTQAWFRSQRNIRDQLLAPGTPFAGYFSLPAVERILDNHDRGYNCEKQIFMLLAIDNWMSSFLCRV